MGDEREFQEKIRNFFNNFDSSGKRHVIISINDLKTFIRKQEILFFMEKSPETFYEIFQSIYKEVKNFETFDYCEEPIITICDYPKLVTVSSIRTDDIDKIVRISCIVIKEHNIGLKLYNSDIYCNQCQDFSSTNNKNICNKCHSRDFRFLGEPKHDIIQRYTVEDLVTHEEIEIICKNNLVDFLCISMNCFVTGIVRVVENSMKIKFLLDVVSVMEIEYPSCISLLKRDIGLAINISKNYILPNLIHSVLPDCKLYPMLKLAILLSLFATEKDPVNLLIATDRNKVKIIDFISTVFYHSVVLNNCKTKDLSSYTVGSDLCRVNGGLLLIDDFSKIKNENVENAIKNKFENSKNRKIKTEFSCIAVDCIDASLLNKDLKTATDLDEVLLNYFSLRAIINTRKQKQSLNTSGTSSEGWYDFPKWTSTSLSLEDRIEVPHKKSVNIISVEELSKYSMYARRFIQPVIDNTTRDKLIAYSKEIISRFPTYEYSLVNMLNLSKARARMELREYITDQDLYEIYELIFWFNERTNQKEQNRKLNKMCILSTFLDKCKEQVKRNKNVLSYDDLIKIFNSFPASKKFSDVSEIITLLNNDGSLLKCGDGSYRIGSLKKNFDIIY